MEIMVVLAVIALLTATLYPSYALARQRANVSTLLSSSPKVLQYLELYRIDHQLYPTGNVVLDESQTGTDMLKAYYERSTPWPWDKEKKLENFFAYSSEETPARIIAFIFDCTYLHKDNFSIFIHIPKNGSTNSYLFSPFLYNVHLYQLIECRFHASCTHVQLIW